MHDLKTVMFDAEQIMEQAQVFASAWSLVGGCFDSGSMLAEAESAKAELRTMIEKTLAAAPTPAAQSADHSGEATEKVSNHVAHVRNMVAAQSAGQEAAALTDEQILAIAVHHFKKGYDSAPASLAAFCDCVRAVIIAHAAPVNGGEFRKRICAALMIPESLDDEAVITTVELTDYEFRRLFAESVNGGERANLEGLRTALLDGRPVARDAEGWYCHPALPLLDENIDIADFLAPFGIEAVWVSMQDGDSADIERYSNDPDSGCAFWTPATPLGEGWMILSIHDHEDGPFALFARRAAAEPKRAADAQQACSPFKCEAALRDGVLCAEEECDRASGVRPADAQQASGQAPTLWESFEMGFAFRGALFGHVFDGRDVCRLTVCDFWHPSMQGMHIGTDLHVGLTKIEAAVRLKQEVRRRLDAFTALTSPAKAGDPDDTDSGAGARLRTVMTLAGAGDAVSGMSDADADACRFSLLAFLRRALERRAKVGGDEREAIARAKEILELVDDYHERPSQATRTKLRIELTDEFSELIARAALSADGGDAELLDWLIANDALVIGRDGKYTVTQPNHPGMLGGGIHENPREAIRSAIAAKAKGE